MNEMQAIAIRHSVRQFTDQPIEEEVLQELRQEIEAINEESGLSFRLFSNEPTAFDGFLAHFGKFQKARNYFALIGKRAEDLEERVGYYG
ncbi:MAG: nitroreductase family protein, partial [Bacillales bacterium]|nr:nitroreductase family protein [Bacillales bacterium]MDY5920261.1 nitroreductase family protein [Candidatus Enteromonas sp.]